MRTSDIDGSPCPSTLGEYRDLWNIILGTDTFAVWWIDNKIRDSSNGRDEEVISPDSQVMSLFAQLVQKDLSEAEGEKWDTTFD